MHYNTIKSYTSYKLKTTIKVNTLYKLTLKSNRSHYDYK